MTTIRIDVLQAVNCAATVEQTRYYLGGVNITCDVGRVTYVATNGHILLADCIETPDCELRGSWTIPSDIIAGFKVTKRHGAEGVLTLSGEHLSIEYAGKATLFAPIDGSFPDWRRVMPAAQCDELCHFDFELLSAFAKASKKVGAGKAFVRQNGGSPAFVRFAGSDTMFGVAMPWRIDKEQPLTAPEWVGLVADTNPAPQG